MFYEHLAWFTVLWVSLLIVRWLWHAPHQRVPASGSSPKRKMPRPPQAAHPHRLPGVWAPASHAPLGQRVQAGRSPLERTEKSARHAQNRLHRWMGLSYPRM